VADLLLRNGKLQSHKQEDMVLETLLGQNNPALLQQNAHHREVITKVHHGAVDGGEILVQDVLMRFLLLNNKCYLIIFNKIL